MMLKNRTTNENYFSKFQLYNGLQGHTLAQNDPNNHEK